MRTPDIAHHLPGSHPPIEHEQGGGTDEDEFARKHSWAQENCKFLNDNHVTNNRCATPEGPGTARLTDKFKRNTAPW